jgi:hypothetical protein
MKGLIALCMPAAAAAQDAKVTPLMTRDLTEMPGRETNTGHGRVPAWRIVPPSTGTMRTRVAG